MIENDFNLMVRDDLKKLNNLVQKKAYNSQEFIDSVKNLSFSLIAFHQEVSGGENKDDKEAVYCFKRQERA